MQASSQIKHGPNSYGYLSNTYSNTNFKKSSKASMGVQ